MKRFILGGLAAVLCVTSSARAWNNVGHMTVAQIAWNLLTPEERAKAAAILKSTPFYDKLLQENLAKGEDPGEWAFLKAATFPDEVRPSKPGDKVFKDRTLTQYHHGPWHYVTLPLDVYDDVEATTQPATQATQPASAVMAAKPFAHDDQKESLYPGYAAEYAALMASDTKPLDRAIALCWVEHLVGDIHQPLHVTSEYSKRFPKGDQGGNLQVVKAEGVAVNLHSLWDEILGSASEWSVKQFPDAFTINFLTQQISTDPRFDLAHDPDYAAHKTIEQWGDESRQYAVSFVYMGGSLKSDVYKYPPKGTPVGPIVDPEAPALPNGYVENARTVAMLRIAEAGHRLADVLHAALAAK